MDKWVSRIEELVSFLANLLTVWVAVESLSLFRRGQMLPLFRKMRQLIDTDEVREDIPSPIVQNTTIIPLAGTLRLNVFDTVPMGLNGGYTALRHRQNAAAYYYSQGATDTPLPLRFL